MKKLLYTIFFSFFILMGSDLSAQSQNLLEQGMRFVEQNAEKWELIESDYKNALVSDMYTNKNTGVTYIYLVQSYEGIPIQNAITTIVISPEGNINVTRPGFVSNLKDKVEGKESITPLAAIKSATAHLGIIPKSMPSVKRADSKNHTYEYGEASFCNNELVVKQVYIENNDKYTLAWNLAIDDKESVDYYNVFVNANTGEVIKKINYTVKCKFHNHNHGNHANCEKTAPISNTLHVDDAVEALNAVTGTYNVFALPTESPTFGGQQLISDPYFSDASPFGWHDTNGMEGPEWTITRGNNVHAFLDKENMDSSSGDEPDGGADLVFDLPFDVANEAVVNEDAATVNLFYMVNMMHDISKRLGFDEQAGNFQANNYGNGGNSNDFILAQASDGRDAVTPSFNNANFGTPPDGGNGRMQMFLWNNPSGVLSIDEPAEIAGFVPNVRDAQGANGFGAPIPEVTDSPITGKVVVATDAIPGEGTTCCGEISNPDEVAGNVALIDRGLCDFSLKAYNAQVAGAISVIICNVEGASALGGMSGGEQAELVTITPLFIEKEDCDRIRASILSDIDVVITIQNRPPMGPTYLDGSVDNGIIAHEYGHGISNRLVGGPGNSSCLSSDEQAGEGISDYFTLVTTVEEGDQGADVRGIGNFALGLGQGGGGLRTYPYSTDLSINPSVYDDIKTAVDVEGATDIYGVGEVWTAILWDMYWGMVDEFGLDTSWEDEESGNYKAVRLVIEGMKGGPCNPSFIDSRDAILDADTLLYGGAHAQILWTAFAKRGLGYLADDGDGSNDKTDGTQSFEPLPTAIPTLKIQSSTVDLIQPGDDVEVLITAQNHVPSKQTGVVIESIVPEGLTYIDGSASYPATLDGDKLTFDIGDMEFNDELEITYMASSSSSVKSTTLFYDDVDNADQNAYDFGASEGFNLWFQSFEIANSGVASWWASQLDTEVETDFYMDIPAQDIVGDNPALKFYHRYDVETGIDGGFIQISRDGGQIFEDVKDKFVRNGYPVGIAYTTFAIPSLEGFSGSSNEEWVDTYLDLSDYKGESVLIRFRFGTNPTGGTTAANPGWFVDDLEIVDLKFYESQSCIYSEETTGDICAPTRRIIVDSDGITSVDSEKLDGFDISIAPNPASDYLTIGLSAERNTPVQLSFTSIDGTLVSSMNLIVGTDQSVRTINTSELQRGMYLVQVKTQKGLTTKKVVIQ